MPNKLDDPTPAEPAAADLVAWTVQAYLESFLCARRWHIVRRAMHPGGVPLLFVERLPPPEAPGAKAA